VGTAAVTARPVVNTSAKGSIMGDLMTHVEHLSEAIGPRPATTDAEQHAAHYIRDAFESRGLEAEVQDFDSPRTGGWAFAIYHLLTVVAAVVSRWSSWIALILGAVVAAIMWLDLDTRWGLAAFMRKGPSQNVIARHVPRVGRNERVARVVVVAHYDSARSSLASSPGMVRNQGMTLGLMKACTYAVPVLVVLRMIAGRFAVLAVIEPWAWYVTLVPAVYLLLPLLIGVHSALFMRPSPGANDNASGVAALLGLFERLVPEPDPAAAVAHDTARLRASGPTPFPMEGMPEGSPLNYSPATTPDRRPESWTDDGDDISWDTGVISGQTALGLDARPPRSDPVPASAGEAAPMIPDDDESMRLFGVPAMTPPPRAKAPVQDARPLFDGESGSTEPFGPLDAPAPSAAAEGQRRQGLFGGRPMPQEHRGVRDWLGVGSDFDARKKGKDIGSWDNFDDEDDDAGWKGGAASVDDESDPGYAASTAARIRRKVTMNVDRELIEKEVWFVATGAEEVGSVGMKAFLAEYGHDLSDAVIINLDTVGAGALAYITREGMARRYEADRHLVGATRRAVREADLPVKGREYRGSATDATAALARGHRAMSVMAFDINGRMPNRHWSTDTADGVSEDNLKTAVDLVAAIIKEL
jgi:hypothetical protein